MLYVELTSDQARQQADAVQIYKAWRDVAAKTWNAVDGEYVAHLAWRRRGDREYLVERYRRYEKSRGPRGPETEKLKAEYDAERDGVIDRMKARYSELKRLAPVNRAMALGRVPKLAADIIRQLDEHGLLGRKATVVGTHALYAYEARCGVHIRPALMETRDLDFLWDASERLTLAIAKIRPPSVFALLREVDPTFESHYGLYAANRSGFEVELLAPQRGDEDQPFPTGLSDDADIDVTPYVGIGALLSLPMFEGIAIDQRGMPLRIVAPEPRAFAFHKAWVAKQPSRNPLKRGRDREQSNVVKELARDVLGLAMDPSKLAELPDFLRTRS
jgi:hypothetical protein